MVLVIVVSGTPGTGKTTLSKFLAKKLNFRYVDVNKIVKQDDLCEEYDEKKLCYVVDVDKLVAALNKLIDKSKDDLIIDSHLAHHLPREKVKLAIIAKCDLKKLKARLEKRGYPPDKVRENLDAEIFDNCLSQADELGHTVLIVDTSHPVDQKELLKKIKEELKREKFRS